MQAMPDRQHGKQLSTKKRKPGQISAEKQGIKKVTEKEKIGNGKKHVQAQSGIKEE